MSRDAVLDFAREAVQHYDDRFRETGHDWQLQCGDLVMESLPLLQDAESQPARIYYYCDRVRAATRGSCGIVHLWLIHDWLLESVSDTDRNTRRSDDRVEAEAPEILSRAAPSIDISRATL